MKHASILAFLLAVLVSPCPAQDTLQRRLYVTERSGLSVYDIDQGHQVLR